jgi:hypothetical protein
MLSDDFKRNGMWVQSFRVGGEKVFTKTGRLWNKMTARCKKDGSYQKAGPSYVGCTNGFKDFQDFADWCVAQKGYDLDCVLDKDILVKGNLTYSRDTCSPVPKALNGLLVGRKPQRGSSSTGVHYIEEKGKYRPQVSRFGRNVYLGLYATEQEAFGVYKRAKESYVKVMAELHKGLVEQRVIDALMNYEVTPDGS